MIQPCLKAATCYYNNGCGYPGNGNDHLLFVALVQMLPFHYPMSSFYPLLTSGLHLAYLYNVTLLTQKTEKSCSMIS